LTYARRDLKAAALIDLATLTGACGVALGEAAAGLWSNHDQLRDRVLAASSRAGERLWPMPLFPEYESRSRAKSRWSKIAAGGWREPARRQRS
jgi:leucyl aminopeptidase